MSNPKSEQSATKVECKNRNLASILMFLALFLPSYVSAEAFTLAMLLLCLIMLALQCWRIEWPMIRFVMPLLLLILFGVSGLAFFPIVDVVKDLWYFAKAILAIFLGYMLCRSIGDSVIIAKIIVLAAVATAIIHLAQIAMYPEVMTKSFVSIRKEVARGYYISAIGVATLFAFHRMKISLFRSPVLYLSFAVMAASVVLSFSRTQLLILAIMIMTIYSMWRISSLRRMLLIAFLLVGVGGFFYFGAEVLNEQPNIGPNKTFVGKTLGSLKEIIPSDYSDPKDIHANWRGYEAYQALQVYTAGNAWQYVFGRGFGALIDLKLNIVLGEHEMRYVPITHNGFPYLLVKTGLAGLVCYLFFFGRILAVSRSCKPVSNEHLFATWMLAGLSLSLFLSTLSISGLFNKSALTPLVILLGAFLYSCVDKHKMLQMQNAS